MAEPEHIGEILKRVFLEIEEKYKRNGGRAAAPWGGCPERPPAPTLSGREDGKQAIGSSTQI